MRAPVSVFACSVHVIPSGDEYASDCASIHNSLSNATCGFMPSGNSPSCHSGVFPEFGGQPPLPSGRSCFQQPSGAVSPGVAHDAAGDTAVAGDVASFSSSEHAAPTAVLMTSVTN